MIFTVFSAAPDPATEWQAELLEYSWRRVGQPGELIRLAPRRSGQASPRLTGRVVETLAWNPHPYTDDTYTGYDTPAAVLEWLFRENPVGTVLLLAPHTVLQREVTQEVSPGKALATAWPDMPLGDGGPFGLTESFKLLECYCVNRELPLAPVRLPLLIHTSDLRKIAARWLELTSIIRAEAVGVHGKFRFADRLAYAVAAAEYRVTHSLAELCCDTGSDKDLPIIDYSQPVEAKNGEIVWDEKVYRPWDPVFPEQAQPGAGRDMLAMLHEMLTRRESGADLSATRPRRRTGVREARVVEDLHLEIPGSTTPIILNSSAAVIWELCDGQRTLAQIVEELQERFEAPADTVRAAVESTARELESSDALKLEYSQR
jgi:hypothetical protein